MQKSRSSHRCWKLIRIAFLWAQKRRVFRKRLVKELRSMPKFLKSITSKHLNRPKAIVYQEEQFSFDATPIINYKKLSRTSKCFSFPCIRRSKVDYDFEYGYDFVRVRNDDEEAIKSFLKEDYGDYLNNDNDDDEAVKSLLRIEYRDYNNNDAADDEASKNLLKIGYGDQDNKDANADQDGDDDYYHDCEFFEEMEKIDVSDEGDGVANEEEIDVKAEDFIAKFYEQMKLQRQLSYARYNEMLDRSIS